MSELNEEEIIKKIKELLYNPDFDYILLKDEEGFTTWHTVFEGLLKLYKQEKEKNKELEENYDKLTKHFIENHISKDKIKEKIKEREHIIHNAKLKFGQDYDIYDDVIYARQDIELYKELLEGK